MILTEQNIKVGQSIVRYSHPKHSNLKHEGIIVQETTTFIRIYKAEPPNKDCSQISSELFPKVHCTVVGELKHKIRIEPQLL